MNSFKVHETVLTDNVSLPLLFLVVNNIVQHFLLHLLGYGLTQPQQLFNLNNTDSYMNNVGSKTLLNKLIINDRFSHVYFIISAWL